MKLLLCACLVVGMVGCSGPRQLPLIAGYHWHRDPTGAVLYEDSTGAEAASFIGTFFDSAQVCIFKPNDKFGCQYFENDGEAIDSLVKFYAGRSKARP